MSASGTKRILELCGNSPNLQEVIAGANRILNESDLLPHSTMFESFDHFLSPTNSTPVRAPPPLTPKPILSYPGFTSSYYDRNACPPELKTQAGKSISNVVEQEQPKKTTKKKERKPKGEDKSGKKGRKRKVNMQNWKANRAKQLRSECKPYETKTGLKQAKAPKPIDCSRCRFKCTLNFTEDDRLALCKAYWELRDYNRQKDFLIQHVKTVEPKRRREGAKRQRVLAKQYFLKTKTASYRVCASFFEKTLCISNGPINTAQAKKNDFGCFVGSDKRGHKTPGNAIGKEHTDLVKAYVNSFPHILPTLLKEKSKLAPTGTAWTEGS